MAACAVAAPAFLQLPNRFHDLLFTGTFFHGLCGMSFDTIRAFVTCATAIAISCLVFLGRAPSFNVVLLKLRQASIKLLPFYQGE